MELKMLIFIKDEVNQYSVMMFGCGGCALVSSCHWIAYFPWQLHVFFNLTALQIHFILFSFKFWGSSTIKKDWLTLKKKKLFFKNQRKWWNGKVAHNEFAPKHIFLIFKSLLFFFSLGFCWIKTVVLVFISCLLSARYVQPILEISAVWLDSKPPKKCW